MKTKILSLFAVAIFGITLATGSLDSSAFAGELQGSPIAVQETMSFNQDARNRTTTTTSTTKRTSTTTTTTTSTDPIGLAGI